MESELKTGQKRKRYEPPQEELSVRIGGKIHHEKKEVHRASKRAKVFETQKVVKRLKDLRKKGDDAKAIEVFEAELTSLKSIDHDAIGNSAFRSKVFKDHTLRNNEDIKGAISKELEDGLVTPAEPGTTIAKIQSRLLSSKILASQVAASVESLKILLNPSLKYREKADPDPNALVGPLSKIRKGSSTSAPSPKEKEKAKATKSVPKPQGVDDSSDSSVNDDGWESGSIDEDAGIDEDGWESGSVGSPRSTAGLHHGSDEDGESGRSGSDQESESSDEALSVRPLNGNIKSSTAVTKDKGAVLSTAQSTFLPSLSVGFVRGSDDSDWSDTEGKAGDMPKKNRRGQRARRAIWEKKFGRNANHKKKEADEYSAALARKQAKRHSGMINTGSNAIPAAPTKGASAPMQAKGINITQRQQPVDGGWASRSGGTPLAAPEHKISRLRGDKKDDKPLHPSWEAKRRLKEKESAGIVPSQGKKIKF